MATIIKIESRRRAAESSLTPELKEFIDHTIVPILVRQYLAEEQAALKLANELPSAANSVSNTAAPEPGMWRP
jgi:hypothetical protein